MNKHVSKEEMDKRVKRVALNNRITACNQGIHVLKLYRAELREQLEALG